MIPATATTMAHQEATCAGTPKLRTRQQRYEAKMKAARKRRKEAWEKRKYAYQSLEFDGRISNTVATGVPRLGTIDLRNYL